MNKLRAKLVVSVLVLLVITLSGGVDRVLSSGRETSPPAPLSTEVERGKSMQGRSETCPYNNHLDVGAGLRPALVDKTARLEGKPLVVAYVDGNALYAWRQGDSV